MKSWLLIFFSLTFCVITAQNLVQNPSFEDTIACPYTPNQLNYAKFWYSPTQGSPDYFNKCDQTIYGMNVPYTGGGYQNARTGNAFAGYYAFQKGIPNYREYIQVQLSDTLLATHQYLVSFYVNLTNGSQYSISTLGAYFSSSPIAATTSLVLNYNPQIKNNPSNQLSDSVGWMLIQDTLNAIGGELYLTIGNFNDDSQSDTSYIGWFSSNNIAYYYIDDVSVIGLDGSGIETQSRMQLHVYPNPASDFLVVEASGIRGKISVIDLLGNCVLQKPFDVKEHLDLSAMPIGIYFLKIESNKKTFIQKFVKE